MRRVTLLALLTSALLVACSEASSPPDDRARRSEPLTATFAAATAVAAPQESLTSGLILAGVQAFMDYYYEEPDPAHLFSDAWEGAASALRAAGVSGLPPTPDFPRSVEAAGDRFRESLPRLEEMAMGHVSDAELVETALHALAVRRDDPHTSYRSRELVARDRATRQGDGAVQIGAGFSRTEPPLVVRVPPGSPAEQAGLRVGESVIAVNAVLVSNGADIPRLVDVREGVPNTFTVEDAKGRRQDRVIMPARYVRPIEEHQVVEGRIGVVRLYGFPASDEVVRRLREALLDFERSGVRGWVLDLRDNGGGPIETVIAVAGLFLEEGALFEEQHRGRTLQSVAVEGASLPMQRPLVAVVDPGSFSGGEILPAILRSRGRAVVVGEQTGGGFGSSVTVPLPDGSALNVTTTEVVIGPERRRFNRVGLTPDVVAPRTAEEIAAGRDPQLDAAISGAPPRGASCG